MSTIAAAPNHESAIADPARLAALRETGLLDARPEESFDRITRLARRLLDAPVAVVSLVDDKRQFLLSSAGAASREASLAHAFCRQVVDGAAPVVIGDARNVTLIGDDAPRRGLTSLDALPTRIQANVGAYAGMPLTTPDGYTLGSLCVIDARPRTWSPEDLSALADLAAATMAEIELRHVSRRLDAEVLTDPLTGLGNRSAWETQAPREVACARRFGQPLVLALLALDRFKRYNDRHGNQAGDALLRETVQEWATELRDVDVMIRLGGVEFALLMPATGIDPAFDVVDALRRRLTRGVTCSAGLAILRDGETASSLLDRADAALVRAKRSGRKASALAS